MSPDESTHAPHVYAVTNLKTGERLSFETSDIREAQKLSGWKPSECVVAMERFYAGGNSMPNSNHGVAIRGEASGKLTHGERQELPTSAFAIPETRDYPIEDISHARNALARVSAYGSPDEKYRIKQAVYARYPQLIPIRQTPAWTTTYPRFPFTGQVTGKEQTKALIKRVNEKGNKIRLEFAGMKNGQPVFDYQLYQLRSDMMNKHEKAAENYVGIPRGNHEARHESMMSEIARLKSEASRPGAIERIHSQHGDVILREVGSSRNRRYHPEIKEMTMNLKRKRTGTDLGAGVVREGHRQHVRLD